MQLTDCESFLAGDELFIGGVQFLSFSGVRVAPNILYYFKDNADNQIIAGLNIEFQWQDKRMTNCE